MKRDAILRLEEISFSYGKGRPALDRVTLEIRPGERVAALGPNGAGKSTLFLCMNGVLAPQEGGIFLKGEQVGRRDMGRLRRAVGVVFQDADSQIVAPTVFKEIAFGPVNLGLPDGEVRARARRAVERMGLAGMEGRVPYDMSGGEKKRVTIGDILAMEPEVVVFDEPAASLDAPNQSALEDVMRELGDAGKAVVLSTHDVDFAYRFAERILVFSRGCLIADGRAEDIFADGEVLREADLERPSLLDFYGLLVEKGALKDHGRYPKSLGEISQWMDADGWRR